MKEFITKAIHSTRHRDAFIVESNMIEGENIDYRLHYEAFDLAVSLPELSLENILKIHYSLTKHIPLREYGHSCPPVVSGAETETKLGINLVKTTEEEWRGKLRNVNVTVGGMVCPKWEDVPALVDEYIKQSPHYNAWTAYNEFEMIHPFKDYNGRTGRLIWLHKALGEGYNFKLSFLEAYHYQTLKAYRLG